MTTPLDDDLAVYWSQCCEGKERHSARRAHALVERLRAGGRQVEAYRCPFAGDQHPEWPFHVGHALTMYQLARIAALLRARSGNAPAPPGSGTTRRQRRQRARHTKGS